MTAVSSFSSLFPYVFCLLTPFYRPCGCFVDLVIKLTVVEALVIHSLRCRLRQLVFGYIFFHSMHLEYVGLPRPRILQCHPFTSCSKPKAPPLRLYALHLMHLEFHWLSVWLCSLNNYCSLLHHFCKWTYIFYFNNLQNCDNFCNTKL